MGKHQASSVGTRPDPASTASQIVRDRFPEALASYLCGSAARGQTTATSDLDVVVVLPGRPAPFRQSLVVAGWPVELFVHDEASLRHWYEREAAASRPVLADMIATGLVLTDAGPADRLKRAATEVLALGPAPLGVTDVATRRYMLSDALADLEACEDPDERDVVAGLVMACSAELFLLSAGAWLGTGKWLIRRMREVDASLTSRLLGAHRTTVATGDAAALIAVADEVLRPHGGRLMAGYTVR